VLAENGYIVTNCHVVESANAITVQLSDDRVFRASLVGADETSDLAVLYVDAQDLAPAQFGDSDTLRVGDTVCAIGDPLGVELRGTMTNGIISAINRDITTNGRTMTLIQTNAALNSGNSGGPLINNYGQVVGINTMKIGDYMSSAGVEGLGFAIPSTTVVDIVSQLINQGYVSGRPCIGFTGEPVSALYQYYYRLPEGLFITEVTNDSDAAHQGLTSGDILVTLDGTGITTMDELTSFLYSCEVGDTVEAVIYRGKKYYTISLTIEEAKG
jgi:serine protease Do